MKKNVFFTINSKQKSISHQILILKNENPNHFELFLRFDLF